MASLLRDHNLNENLQLEWARKRVGQLVISKMEKEYLA